MCYQAKWSRCRDDHFLNSHLDCSESIVPMEEQALLVIDDAIANIEEGQLLG